MGTFQDFKDGLRSGIPICLGYIAVSFAFGIQAVLAGLTPVQASMMSLLNLTSAGQLASLNLIAGGAPYLEMAFVQLVINLRYMLMSTALTQKLGPSVGLGHRMAIAYGVTDEIFAVSVTKSGELRPAFSYGITLISILGWVFGTALGAVAGQIMPPRLISALGLAIYGMFIAIIVPEARDNKPVLLVVLAAMVMSTAFTFAPVLKQISSGIRIIVITILISAIAALAAPIVDPKTGKKDTEEGDGAHA